MPPGRVFLALTLAAADEEAAAVGQRQAARCTPIRSVVDSESKKRETHRSEFLEQNASGGHPNEAVLVSRAAPQCRCHVHRHRRRARRGGGIERRVALAINQDDYSHAKSLTRVHE
jgi:hypothetical protein